MVPNRGHNRLREAGEAKYPHALDALPCRVLASRVAIAMQRRQMQEWEKWPYDKEEKKMDAYKEIPIASFQIHTYIKGRRSREAKEEEESEEEVQGKDTQKYEK